MENTITHHDHLIDLRVAVDNLREAIISTRHDQSDFSEYQAKTLIDEIRAYWNAVEPLVAAGQEPGSIQRARILSLLIGYLVSRVEHDDAIDPDLVTAVVTARQALLGVA